MSRLRGMTLIEVLVVLFLVALSLTWAIPALQNIQTHHRREQDIHALMNALRHARKQSLLWQTTVLVCPREGEAWQQGLQIRMGKQVIHQFAPLSPGSQLTWRGLAGSQFIYFNASQVANQSNGHFDYMPRGAKAVTDQVIVNRAGYIHRQRVN